MNQVFNIEIKEQNDISVRFQLKKGEQYLSFKEVFEFWKKDPEFIEFYIVELIKLKHEAFCWEHPAINKELLNMKYECVLQKNKPLEYLPSNENAFKKYIHTKNQIEDFLNLGKDARLVVPTKRTDKEIYNHLGKFIRFAEKEQIIEVFKRVGITIFEEIEKQKLIWLNTAGLGVIWLHIRMDTTPKYYKTIKYKEPDFLKSIN